LFRGKGLIVRLAALGALAALVGTAGCGGARQARPPGARLQRRLGHLRPEPRPEQGPVPARQGDRGEGGALSPRLAHGGGGRQQAHRILPPAARKLAALRRRLSPAHGKQGVHERPARRENAIAPCRWSSAASAPV